MGFKGLLMRPNNCCVDEAVQLLVYHAGEGTRSSHGLGLLPPGNVSPRGSSTNYPGLIFSVHAQIGAGGRNSCGDRAHVP